MPREFLFLFAGIGLSVVAGGVAAAVFWLKKLRETVLISMMEMTGHQIRATKHINDALDRLQKHQDAISRQIHALTEEELRLKQELSAVSSRLELEKKDNSGRPTVH